MSKVVIFDWGGVLMRTHEHRPRHAWDKRLGLPPGSVERAVHGSEVWKQAQRGEISEDEYWQIIGDHLGLDTEALTDLRCDFYAGDQLDENLVTLIRDLHGRGVPVGLMSNNVPSLSDEMAALGLDDLFDACVISAEIGVMKPDAGAFQAILDRLGVEAQEAIFVDDFPENVAGARAVGMEGICFQPDIDLQRELEKWLSE